MNEKIRQLADEAGITDNNLSDGNMSHTDLKKFAELIVRECADVVSNQYSADWGKWSNRMILEHFGVEE